MGMETKNLLDQACGIQWLMRIVNHSRHWISEQNTSIVSAIVFLSHVVVLVTLTNYRAGFFNTFNKIFPLFDADTFNKEYERRPNVTAKEDAAWYAALNMVIAIGSLISATFVIYSIEAVNPGPLEEGLDLQCWKYFKNASTLYIDLTFRESNLMAVQAMIAMVGSNYAKFMLEFY
jgi:hypothetical protein